MSKSLLSSRGRVALRSFTLLGSTSALAVLALQACGGSDDATFGGGGGADAGVDSGGTAGIGGSGGSAGTSGSAGTGGSGGATQECGNKIVEGTERCDDGNTTNGDGCENTCDFTCEQDTHCSNGNPCDGEETCDVDAHTCSPGTALGEGEACSSDGKVCVGGVCQGPDCGDGQLQDGEECDDGNATQGDGCDGCRFTCVSTDATRDCSTSAECQISGTCDDATHKCGGGGPATDNSPCNGGADYCLAGVCTANTCGDGNLEPGETCDDGDTDDTNGCTQLCEYSCTGAGDCGDANSCTQDVCNPTSHVCSNPADTTANGKVCTVGGVTGNCSAGSCVPADCGNGTTDVGEECDNGPGNNGAGTGCSSSCQNECDATVDCTDGNLCNGSETCVTRNTGKACSPGSNQAQGTVCTGASGPRRVCNGSGGCVGSTCGDGYLDNANGGTEACEPPNTATCDANCQLAAVCGDGTINPGEDCDDGGRANLDGCDSNCKYEAIVRLTDADISGSNAPSWCTSTTNALGRTVVGGLALGTLNSSLASGINDGTTNILVQALDLNDLTGTADPAVRIGLMTGGLDPARGTWPNVTGPGNAPLDWHFLVAGTTVDTNGLPTGILSPGSISGRVINAGPGAVDLTLLLAGSPAVMTMRNAKIRGTFGTTTSVPAAPPGSLAAGARVFETIVATASGSNGQGLCGDITVESLAQIPVPEDLATGGATACGNCGGGRQYTYCGAGNPVGAGCNSLLDVFVGGCKTRQFICVTAINATPRPDRAGTDGDTDTLTLGAGNKVPASQTTGNDDGYSSYLTFEGKRAHITGRQ